MNKALSEASLLVFAVSKSEIIGSDLSTLDTLVKRLTKNKEMTISKRASAEIFFPEYDSDPRELYQIPEVRRWFRKTIDEEFPWFYFLNHNVGISLTVLYCCTCKVSFQGIYDNKHGLELDPDETGWWLEQNFLNLNKFVEVNGISEKINREVSAGIANWFKAFLSSDAANFVTN
ncbi:chlororespiratory reduction 6 domain-containing protein [Chroococcidiopsis sp.]|uniref:chlororespiratory reduction 6 domain-containing protein n=1 Tax=Chroococcidiopsis sp. TaxID=3088168 RepID=UPI003F32C6F6